MRFAQVVSAATPVGLSKATLLLSEFSNWIW
jgi:hypothetical protein